MKTHTRHITTTWIVAASALGVALGAARDANAICDSTPADVSATDRALFAVHGCDTNYANMHKAALYIADDLDWVTTGIEQPCANSFEYAKHLNATWLVAVLPHITDFPQSDRPFHDGSDYFGLIWGVPQVVQGSPVAQANGKRWHDKFF